MPAVCDWPKFEGFWGNALSVYIEDPKLRGDEWSKCIFFEVYNIILFVPFMLLKHHAVFTRKDEEFVVVYD